MINKTRYLREFLKIFLDGEMDNGSLYREITSYPDYDFFIDLQKFLILDTQLELHMINRYYIDISISYYKAKKYFEEH